MKKPETKIQTKIRKQISALYPSATFNRHNPSPLSLGCPDLTIFLNNGSDIYGIEVKSIKHDKVKSFFEDNTFQKISNKYINKALSTSNKKDPVHRIINQTKHILNNNNCCYINYDKTVKTFILVKKGYHKEFKDLKKLILALFEKNL